MKKSILMLAAGALLMATPSCKKGENDPFLSLASRKARVTGEWDVTAKSGTTSTTSGDWTSTTTVSLSGNTETTTSSVTNSGTTTSTTSTRTINQDHWMIEKDGTFTRNYDYVYTEEDDNGFTTTTTTHTVTTTISGTWSFVGKAKDEYKNKERIVFNILSSSDNDSQSWVTKWNSDGTTVDDGTESDSDNDTYSHGEYVWAVDIDQLKGKEMIWKMEGDGSSSYSQTSGSTTTTSTSTTTGLETWTLTNAK